MRFLIVAAVFACAAAAPSGLLAPYSAGLVSSWGSPLAVAAPLALAPIARTVAVPAVVPTIPPGDIQGAAIDATVNAVDAVRAVNDQAAELQGRAINAAEDHAWQSVNAVQTAQAQVDGAAASVAPNVAKSLVAPVAVAPIAVAPIAPVAAYAAVPSIYSAAPSIYSAAPSIYSAAPIAISAGSQSISTQSLSQTHPSPALISAPVAYATHGW